MILGSLLSPAHSALVRERYRTHINEIIPAPHRLMIAQLLVQNSQWLAIDPWEITRRRAMDYLSLLEHIQTLLTEAFPSIQTPIPSSNSPYGNNNASYDEQDDNGWINNPYKIQVFYLCKPNMIPKLSPIALKGLQCHVICVCRSLEADLLRNSLHSKWNGIIHIVEDSAILDAAFDQVTSRKVREKIKLGQSVETYLGAKINEYVNVNRFGAKFNGLEDWTVEEKRMPTIASRPAEPALKPLPSALLNNNNIANTNSNNMGIPPPPSYSSQHTGGANYLPSWNHP